MLTFNTLPFIKNGNLVGGEGGTFSWGSLYAVSILYISLDASWDLTSGSEQITVSQRHGIWYNLMAWPRSIILENIPAFPSLPREHARIKQFPFSECEEVCVLPNSRREITFCPKEARRKVWAVLLLGYLTFTWGCRGARRGTMCLPVG